MLCYTNHITKHYRGIELGSYRQTPKKVDYRKEDQRNKGLQN